ncbi:MAG: hypothetical protein HKN13_12345 [Rhodothermales bacterium]|nr:hypothetical protein [Rhodothermales bacterium]
MTSPGNDPDSKRRPVRLENPTILGKLVGIGTTAAKVVGGGVDLLLNTVADIVVDAEKAFKDGMDPNVDDAKIISESERRRKKKGTKRGPGGSSKS